MDVPPAVHYMHRRMHPPERSSPVELTELTEAQVPATAALLAEAFGTNPVYGYIFHPSRDPKRGLQWVFERDLRLHMKKRCTRVVASGTVDATLTWVPPEGVAIGLWDLVKQGVLLMPLRFGASALLRMVELMESIEQMQQRLWKGRPHGHLELVAVRPELRGRGIASRMVREHLEAVVDAQPARDEAGRPLSYGHPVSLTTQLESNVRLYRALGFEVVEENTLGKRSGGGVRNYFMVRESRYSRAGLSASV